MKQYNDEPNISTILRLIFTVTPLIFVTFIMRFLSVILDLEKEIPKLASFISKFQAIIGLIIAFIIILEIGRQLLNLSNFNIKNKYPSNKKSQDNSVSVTVKGKLQPVQISNSSAVEKNKKSNPSIPMNISPKTIYRPNVDKILSIIQYVEDLQKQIKNGLNTNKIASPSQLQLSDIDQSIFVKFNILQEKFISDYQAVDWKNNINQEISNFYQKIYDKHLNLLQEQYDYIKNYFKDYLDNQAIKSEEILNLIKKIID